MFIQKNQNKLIRVEFLEFLYQTQGKDQGQDKDQETNSKESKIKKRCMSNTNAKNTDTAANMTRTIEGDIWNAATQGKITKDSIKAKAICLK